MYHLHRKKLFDRFSDDTSGLIYLKGGTGGFWYDTDTEIDFRQESNFMYLTGVDEADFSLLMDLESQKYTLVVPERDATFATWNGKVYPKEYYLDSHEADQIIFDTELEDYLQKRKPDHIYTYDDEQAEPLKRLGYSVNSESLKDALVDCRVIKTEFEIDLMRTASIIASEAHKAVLAELQAGANEHEMRALFLYHCQVAGQRHEPYVGIHAGGQNASVLHYIVNNQPLEDGDLYLIDAGASHRGYAADITRTYPINGTFSPIQRDFYSVTLNAHKRTIDAAKAGVKMEDLHLMASEIIVGGLADMGLLRGTVSDLMENNIFALFFPHGLGHFLGLDTHDVGGYPKGVERIERPGIRYLRARRELEPGMVITIEPGIYFIEALLGPAIEDPEKKRFLNVEKISRLMNFGGIRIEDNIVIREEGYENLTDVPKEIEDIEDFMNS